MSRSIIFVLMYHRHKLGTGIPPSVRGLDYRLDNRGNGVRICRSKRYFSSLYSQTNPGAQPASSPVGTGRYWGYFLSGIVAGA
jgi:hypothetical protein